MNMNHELIRYYSAKILASPHFSRCETLKSFLRYTIDKSLCGQTALIKEYSIAVEVFGKPDSFDPRLDPVVRVQARRLRHKMRLYYETDGSNDSLRIVYKPGS